MALVFLLSSADQKLFGPSNLATIAQTFTEYFHLPDSRVELSCVSLQAIQALNKEYRNLDEPTDVLSFPLFSDLAAIQSSAGDQENLLGSIIICPEKAQLYGETLPQLVHHGLLHLLGFDHEVDLKSWQIAENAIITLLASHNLIIPPIPHDAF